MRIALVDADSIAWILGWVYKDNQDAVTMEEAVNTFMRGILNTTNADAYMVALANSQRSFRHEVYKYKPYKGTRVEKPEWIVYWQPIVTEILCKEWHAVSVPGLEADDIVSYCAEVLGKAHDVIVCSPDKDLRQIPGELFDFNKGTTHMITRTEALVNYFMQMLCGDSTDNIAGVPKVGEVKAKILLSLCGNDPIAMVENVKQEYKKYFNDYYGEMIYVETRCAVELMCEEHPLYQEYKTPLKMLVLSAIHKYEREDLNKSLLSQLGWA